MSGSEGKKEVAYALLEKGGPLVRQEFEFGSPLGDDEVEIRVLKTSLCKTDQSFPNTAGWFFPWVPGHEAIGIITKVGDKVNSRKVGEKVGVGYNYSTCGACAQCNQGFICAKSESMLAQFRYETNIGSIGTFASATRVKAIATFPVPKELNDASASALMCAGVTSYSVLKAHATNATRVGVIGVGAVGSIAILLAKAMGCHVTAFSRGNDKRDLTIDELGAHVYVNTSDEKEFKAARQTVDLIINTVNVAIPYDSYLRCLRLRGKFVQLSLGKGAPLQFSAAILLFNQLSFIGSLYGSVSDIQEMLEFAARHQIKAMVEHVSFTPEGVNEAWKKMDANQARFKMVIDVGSETEK